MKEIDTQAVFGNKKWVLAMLNLRLPIDNEMKMRLTI